MNGRQHAEQYLQSFHWQQLFTHFSFIAIMNNTRALRYSHFKKVITSNALALILGFLLLHATSSAQVSKLDEKNGFNKFILGSTLKDVNRITSLQRVKTDDDTDLQYYSVKDTKSFSIFQYSLRSIQLVFYKNRLMEINAYLESGERAGFISIEVAERISKEYGSWNERKLSGQDEVDRILMKQDIRGDKVSLIRYVFGHRMTLQTNEFVGDRYCFVSVPLYKERERANGNGL